MGKFQRALINEIDTKRLVAQGQRDAVVCFTSAVEANGNGGRILVYRGTPGSELLQQELLRRSSSSMFEPAVFRHQQVPVNVIGTAVFVVRDGQPHLRIFLNQEEAELRKPADFIAPQLAFVRHNKNLPGLRWPKGAPTKERCSGVVESRCRSPRKGAGVSVAYEYPAGLGFGTEAARSIPSCYFIPGFRDGRAVACRFTFPVLFATGRVTKIE